MSANATDTSVSMSIVVDAPVERAFSVFTDGIGSWWPPEHHILQGELEIVFEPRVGGHIYDRNGAGEESHWARVLAYDPPHRLVFSWDVSPQWTIETDPAKTSEVEVRFTPEGTSRTRVDLDHRHIERHGEGWQGIRDAVVSEGGWPLGMRRFAERFAA